MVEPPPTPERGTPAPRVFMGLVEVAGNFSNLKLGFDQLGVVSVLVDTLQHRFGYQGAESRHGLVRILQRVTRRRVQALRGERILLLLWLIFQLLLQFALMIWAIRRYDVFIFGSGHSFLEGYDLPLLKMLRKRTINVFTGSDVRPPYLGFTTENSGPTLIRKSKMIKSRIRRVERHADHVVSSPLYAHFQERPFLIFQIMGIAQPIESTPRLPTPPDGSSVRILHSPSHPEGKGTDRIRNAIATLRAKGVPIDYIELIGKPNSEVRRELARADMVVDELYSDIPMAGLGSEAARFGTPTIVGGYGPREFVAILPKEFLPPARFCKPDEIEETIETMANDHVLRQDLGRQAQDFVRTVWSPALVARRYLDLAQGSVPSAWYYTPRDLRYLAGWGLTLDRARDRLNRVLNEGGRRALFLTDKPELEQLMIDLAEGRITFDSASA